MNTVLSYFTSVSANLNEKKYFSVFLWLFFSLLKVCLSQHSNFNHILTIFISFHNQYIPNIVRYWCAYVVMWRACKRLSAQSLLLCKCSDEFREDFIYLQSIWAYKMNKAKRTKKYELYATLAEIMLMLAMHLQGCAKTRQNCSIDKTNQIAWSGNSSA